MADIFLSQDVRKLLAKKVVLFLGDSNTRAIYKDLIYLLEHNKLVPESHLKRKLENSYEHDKLLKRGELHRGRDYVEEREYKKAELHFIYLFITKAYDARLEEMFSNIETGKTPMPDIFIMNSCLWDLSRWGPNYVDLYKTNMTKLVEKIEKTLPPETLVIWLTTPPLSRDFKSGFLVKQLEFLQYSLRFEVMEANLYASQLFKSHGFNCLDLHYHLRLQIDKRADDGIHWLPNATRHTTNLLLTHIALSMNESLPGKIGNIQLAKMKSLAETAKTNKEPEHQNGDCNPVSQMSEVTSTVEEEKKKTEVLSVRSRKRLRREVNMQQQQMCKRGKNAKLSQNQRKKKNRNRRNKRLQQQTMTSYINDAVLAVALTQAVNGPTLGSSKPAFPKSSVLSKKKMTVLGSKMKGKRKCKNNKLQEQSMSKSVATALSQNAPLPGNVDSVPLDKIKKLATSSTTVDQGSVAKREIKKGKRKNQQYQQQQQQGGYVQQPGPVFHFGNAANYYPAWDYFHSPPEGFRFNFNKYGEQVGPSYGTSSQFGSWGYNYTYWQ